MNNNRLIDADELKRRMIAFATGTNANYLVIENIVMMINQADAVDAVEVIRCRNCQHWMYEAEDIGLCVADVPDIDGVQRYKNDFCSYGERKEG